MYLYRAINLEDLKDLNNGKDLKCSLIRTYSKKLRISASKYYKLCINDKRQFALDTITGHVAGQRLRVGLSPWISTSKDFGYVCREYAIPQAGAYNEAGIRKPVIVIYKWNVLNDANEIKELRDNSIIDDITIDISDDKLNQYYKKAFMSEAYNENMPGFNSTKKSSYEKNPDIYNVQGINNYAKCAKEVLIFKKIAKKDIQLVIYPLLQDILYGCNIDMKDSIKFLIQHNDNIIEFFKKIYNIFDDENIRLFNYLYPNYNSGNNLTDYLQDNYLEIKGDDIYSKYDNLKNMKKNILKKIVIEFNNFFNSNLNLSTLIDDDLYVLDIDNISNITKKQMYDLLLIKRDDELYKYNSSSKKYVYGQKVITKEKVNQILSKKNTKKIS